MTDFDLDRLGDVWRQQPDPAEMERLQKSAAAVARRAQITQVTDIVAAIAVAAVVIFLVASNPKPGTMVIGSAAILILLFSNIRLRRVRRIELEHPIKTLGEHTVSIRLHPDVHAEVRVSVVAE